MIFEVLFVPKNIRLAVDGFGCMNSSAFQGLQ